MELDDFKSSWQALNQKVDQQTALNLQLLRERREDKARHGLRPQVWGQSLQVAFGGFLAILSGSFWWDHLQVTHLMWIGVLFHIYGLAMIISGARMLVLIHRIDFGAPVVGIQKQLAQLRRFYILASLWLGLPWWLLWIPFTVMVFMGLLGVDLVASAPHTLVTWIRWQVVVGITGLLHTLLFIWWARGRPRLAKKLENAAAGISLTKVQGLLAEIARFEQPDARP